MLLTSQSASSVVVTLAVERSGLGELPGSGFLVPPVEGRAIKASTFSCRKWAWTGEVSDEVVHLRASLGRAREEAVLQRDDADLVAVSVAVLVGVSVAVAVAVGVRVTVLVGVAVAVGV